MAPSAPSDLSILRWLIDEMPPAAMTDALTELISSAVAEKLGSVRVPSRSISV